MSLVKVLEKDMNETVYETKVKGALKIKTLDDLNSKKKVK